MLFINVLIFLELIFQENNVFREIFSFIKFFQLGIYEIKLCLIENIPN